MSDLTLRWQTRTLRSPPWINGEQLSGCVSRYGWARQPLGGVVPMIGGRTIYQASPSTEFAPLGLSPIEASLDLEGVSEADRDRIESAWLESEVNPAEIFVEIAMIDLFTIPAEAKTTWTLSRSLPYSRVSDADFAVSAAVIDRTQTGSTETALTVISSGTPSAGELAYDTAVGDSVTTADMSADAGKILRVKYTPLRLFIMAMDEDVSETGGLDIALELSEHIPSRVYVGVD